MRQARLFTPGPTAVPPRVLETQARPLVHHRTPEFREAFREATEGLARILRTTRPALVLATSGTGAMDAVVANLTAPGDTVVVTEIGKFSARWSEIARAYGVTVVPVTAEWGEPVTPDAVETALHEHPEARVLLTTHSETSTAVWQDVEAFARIAHDNDTLVAVDGITSIACHDVRTDDWGLDAIVGGSQKGLMSPPGLAVVALSERAEEKMARGRHASYYLDLRRALDAAARHDTPFTPAISLVLAVREGVRMILEEGLDAVIARHARNAGAVRAAVRAMGLELLSTSPSNATTAVVIPDGRAGEVTTMMEREYGVKVAGGQARLKGRIVRLGHLGDYHEGDIGTMIAAFEATCRRLGIVERFGPGVEAMSRHFEEARA